MTLTTRDTREREHHWNRDCNVDVIGLHCNIRGRPFTLLTPSRSSVPVRAVSPTGRNGLREGDIIRLSSILDTLFRHLYSQRIHLSLYATSLRHRRDLSVDSVALPFVLKSRVSLCAHKNADDTVDSPPF